MGDKERLVWLDALKGIGILSIMRVHILGPKDFLQSILYVGAVAMFFIAAGFNFKIPQDTRAAIHNKFMRLLVPYFFYSLVLLIIEHRLNYNTLIQFFGVFYGRMSLFRDNLNGNTLFLLIGNAPMWFLPCMFLSYLWIYLVYCRCKTSLQHYLVCLLFIFLSAVLYFSPLMLPWSLDTSFLFAVLIIVGYEWRGYFKKSKLFIVAITLALWVVLYHFFAGSNISIGIYGNYGVYSIIPFVAIAICETYALCGVLQMIDNTWFVKVFAYMGKHSLRLMCIHLVVCMKLYQY
ncbi:MAG: acyltransferase family protein [Prevotella sp.]|nr:acyltransferase family protein [Prevotella sp.]